VAASPASTAAGVAVAATNTPAHSSASSKVYKGAVANMRYGPVQVSIRVSGRRITSLSATYPVDRARSRSINSRAVPTLRSEALRAQSARINSVSGATLTSRAFDSSLQSALTKAHI
jgi:uncharacterized protein with FMN-binding domain